MNDKNDFLYGIGDGIKTLSNIMSHIANSIQPHIPKITSFLDGLLKFYVALNEKDKEIIPILIKSGWYFCPSMYLDELLSVTETNVDIVMAAGIKRTLGELESLIAEMHPERERQIREVFELYRLGYYYGCIAVAYSQSEGISKDTGNKNPVTLNKNGLTKADVEHMDERVGSLTSIWHVLASEQSRARINDKELAAGETNRHKVMHGIGVDYPEEKDALKSISFLSNYCWFISIKSEFENSENKTN